MRRWNFDGWVARGREHFEKALRTVPELALFSPRRLDTRERELRLEESKDVRRFDSEVSRLFAGDNSAHEMADRLATSIWRVRASLRWQGLERDGDER